HGDGGGDPRHLVEPGVDVLAEAGHGPGAHGEHGEGADEALGDAVLEVPGLAEDRDSRGDKAERRDGRGVDGGGAEGPGQAGVDGRLAAGDEAAAPAVADV